MIGWIIALVVVVVVVLMVVGIYNRLVVFRNRYKNAYSQIDVQLKRRYDLIPNLVETSKGYLKHEREVLENVIKARGNAVSASQAAAANPGDPKAMQGLMGAENMLTGALSKLFALVEAYPNLKANETMAQLMEELTSTENKIAFSRQAYNDSVMVFNTACETFPNILIAGPLGFTKAELFAVAAEAEKQAPKVQFT